MSDRRQRYDLAQALYVADKEGRPVWGRRSVDRRRGQRRMRESMWRFARRLVRLMNDPARQPFMRQRTGIDRRSA